MNRVAKRAVVLLLLFVCFAMNVSEALAQRKGKGPTPTPAPRQFKICYYYKTVFDHFDDGYDEKEANNLERKNNDAYACGETDTFALVRKSVEVCPQNIGTP